jgi:hypothetical protein
MTNLHAGRSAESPSGTPGKRWYGRRYIPHARQHLRHAHGDLFRDSDLESRELDSDEDRGGHYTSKTEFNVVKGDQVQIAIDGFAGAEEITSWPGASKTPPSPAPILGPAVEVRSHQAPCDVFTAVVESSCRNCLGCLII